MTCAWNHPGEKRSAQRLAAALHGADQKRQHEELPGGGHEIGKDADRCIHREGQKDSHLRADPAASAPNRNENGMPTNCTTTNASIWEFWSMPISAP